MPIQFSIARTPPRHQDGPMSKKFSDEWGDFEIRVNDPRGQNWLYNDGVQTLQIGWNHENPGRGHVYLSEVTLAGPVSVASETQAGANSVSNDAVTPTLLLRSIARFFGYMVKPGGGYSAVQLHLDGRPTIPAGEIGVIDVYLQRYGLERDKGSNANEPVWVKQPVDAPVLTGQSNMSGEHSIH